MSRHILIYFIMFSNISYSQSEIFGLATPIQLTPDTTVVFLQDYFTNVSEIENIKTPSFLKQERGTDKTILKLIVQDDSIPFLSTLDITTKSATYSILLRKSKKQKVIFSFDPKDHFYSNVSVVGEMTNWNPNQQFMQLKDGKWQTTLLLNPGRYQYQLVADGNWFLDPANPDTIENGIGGYNSLLTIGNSNTHFPFTSLEYDLNDDSTVIFRYNATADVHYFIFWDNTQIGVQSSVFYEETYQTTGLFQLPADAFNISRSHLRIYAYNKFGEGIETLIPLDKGVPVTDPSKLTRDDLQRTIIYFMMVDRFNNGDKTNDHPIQDDRVLPPANYYGGDLAGIQQKIDEGYFTSLGINTLWISPVFQNPYNAYQEFPEPHRWFSGYHGYWPISLSQVDTRFGSNQIFKNLVADAHDHGFNIYLDYVANHIHEQHPLWSQHPEWFSDLTLPDGRKNLRLWDEQRLTTWFEPYMPSFDHSQAVVAEACADSAMWWLKEFNIDGFRHDATKHIETEFWRLLTYKIKTEVEIPANRNIYQIGETFGSRELIGSYLGSGLLNAQFDFDLYFDVRAAFANDEVPFTRLAASLNETFAYFGYHHLMGNITGNHDMARFISYASGDLKWGENDKEAGWQRTIEITDTTGYAKLKMLHAFNMTIPGIPIIYYGDEIGIPGANDPDNRRMMQFDTLNRFQSDVKATASKLATLRSSNMALLYGDFGIIYVSDNAFIYRRQYLDNIVYVIFNKSTENFYYDIPLRKNEYESEKITAHFNSIGGPAMHVINPGADPGEYRFYQVSIKPYSFEIITFEN